MTALRDFASEMHAGLLAAVDRRVDAVRRYVLSVPMLHNVLTRLALSLGIRPWLIDIACGLELIMWGVSVVLHPHCFQRSHALNLFAPIRLPLGAMVLLVGALQLWAALLKLVRIRQAAAFLGLMLMAGLASEMQVAMGVAVYAGWALAEAMIVVRIY